MKKLLVFLVILACLPFSTLAEKLPDMTLVYGREILTFTGYEVVYENGEPYVRIDADYTNNGTEAASLSLSFGTRVYQDGIECDNAYLSSREHGDDNRNKKIKDGATLHVYRAAKLYNESSDIEIELYPLFDFSTPKNVVSATFSLTGQSDGKAKLEARISQDALQKAEAAAAAAGQPLDEWLEALINAAE